MSDENPLKRMAAASQEMGEFRTWIENRYKGDPEELKKLLVDILCSLRMEFVIRPKE